MKRRIIIGLTFFILLMMCVLFPTGEALSGVDVSIGIGIGVPPPNVVIAAPPPVYLIPGSYVYFAPDVGFQLFFYSGYWYLLNDGYWYRSAHYRGPWGYLHPSRVPVVFHHLPPVHFVRKTARADVQRHRFHLGGEPDHAGSRKQVGHVQRAV